MVRFKRLNKKSARNNRVCTSASDNATNIFVAHINDRRNTLSTLSVSNDSAVNRSGPQRLMYAAPRADSDSLEPSNVTALPLYFSSTMCSIRAASSTFKISTQPLFVHALPIIFNPDKNNDDHCLTKGGLPMCNSRWTPLVLQKLLRF